MDKHRVMTKLFHATELCNPPSTGSYTSNMRIGSRESHSTEGLHPETLKHVAKLLDLDHVKMLGSRLTPVARLSRVAMGSGMKSI
jgi:hypothetical protein